MYSKPILSNQQYAYIAYFAVLLYSILPVSTTDDSHPVVTAPAGTFEGSMHISMQGYPYRAYEGIPYARPPVDNLRFAKPQPYPKIEGTYDATNPSPICVQAEEVDPERKGQEDCLYLNIYTPASSEEKLTDMELWKVFVYIHGGFFFMGSAQENLPGDLTYSNIIVVTVNYRLSWLGFLKGPTPELPGNQGLWDQLMAIKWVKDNIRSFGGNPNDITIGGESMGGESVSALSISPHSKGLFTQGVIMSGTVFTNPSTPGGSDVLLDLLTDRVGCKDSGDTESVVKCLRGLPTEYFVLPMEGEYVSKFTTIDGDLFPRPVFDLIKDHEYLASVGFYDRNYIVSITNNEGAANFIGLFDIKQDPTEFISQSYGIPLNVSKEALAWYEESNETVFNPEYEFVAYPVTVRPCFKFLETFTDSNKKGIGSVYFLKFDHMPTYMPPPHEGMFHAMDLAYLFDYLPKDILRLYYSMGEYERFTVVDFQLKYYFNRIVADFMISGFPGETLSEVYNINWSAFERESEYYLSFSSKPTIKQFPMKGQREMWKDIFQKYVKNEQWNNGFKGSHGATMWLVGTTALALMMWLRNP